MKNTAISPYRTILSNRKGLFQAWTGLDKSLLTSSSGIANRETAENEVRKMLNYANEDITVLTAIDFIQGKNLRQ